MNTFFLLLTEYVYGTEHLTVKQVIRFSSKKIHSNVHNERLPPIQPKTGEHASTVFFKSAIAMAIVAAPRPGTALWLPILTLESVLMCFNINVSSLNNVQ